MSVGIAKNYSREYDGCASQFCRRKILQKKGGEKSMEIPMFVGSPVPMGHCWLCVGCFACFGTPTPDFEFAIMAMASGPG